MPSLASRVVGKARSLSFGRRGRAISPPTVTADVPLSSCEPRAAAAVASSSSSGAGGTLSRAELVAYLATNLARANGDVSAADVVKTWRQLDADADGLISHTELDAWLDGPSGCSADEVAASAAHVSSASQPSPGAAARRSAAAGKAGASTSLLPPQYIEPQAPLLRPPPLRQPSKPQPQPQPPMTTTQKQAQLTPALPPPLPASGVYANAHTEVAAAPSAVRTPPPMLPPPSASAPSASTSSAASHRDAARDDAELEHSFLRARPLEGGPLVAATVRLGVVVSGPPPSGLGRAFKRAVERAVADGLCARMLRAQALARRRRRRLQLPSGRRPPASA